MDFLTSSGPIITIVYLSTKGELMEHTIDMSPHKLPLVTLLGGEITIHGQYHEHEVIMIKRRFPPPERHIAVFPPPFHRDEVWGDVCFVRMDQHSIPQNYTTQEFLQLYVPLRITRAMVYSKHATTIPKKKDI